MSIGKKVLLAFVLLVFGAIAAVNNWGALIIGIGYGGCSALLLFIIIDLLKIAIRKIRQGTRKAADITKKSIDAVDRSGEKRILDIDDMFYEIAGKEIAENRQHSGLWYKSLSVAEGDESKQRATYIRLRAKQLSDAANSVPQTRDNFDAEIKEKSKNRTFIDSYRWGRVFVLLLVIGFIAYVYIWDRQNPLPSNPAVEQESSSGIYNPPMPEHAAAPVASESASTPGYGILLANQPRECFLPDFPYQIPISADFKQLQDLEAQIIRYQAITNEYRNCLEVAEATVNPTPANRQALIAAWDYSVDMEESITNQFNQAVRYYKERTGQ